jgi:hypothetical protein
MSSSRTITASHPQVNFLYPCQSTQRENSDDPDHPVHHHSSIAAHHADRQDAMFVRRLLIRSWTTLLSKIPLPLMVTHISLVHWVSARGFWTKTAA